MQTTAWLRLLLIPGRREKISIKKTWIRCRGKGILLVGCKTVLLRKLVCIIFNRLNGNLSYETTI